MNAAQFHLLLNHFPVIIPIVGAFLLLLSMMTRPSELRMAAVWVLVLGALSAIPTYLTGEPAEDVVKNYPGTMRTLIQNHENFASLSLTAIEVTGAVSLVLLFIMHFRKISTAKTWIWLSLLALCLVSTALMAQTAHLGGLIRHEEIRTSDHS